MRRATKTAAPEVAALMISIHALHEESDKQEVFRAEVGMISIHALHEESDTLTLRAVGRPSPISIHALHEESDQRIVEGIPDYGEFQSTLSMRRATK